MGNHFPWFVECKSTTSLTKYHLTCLQHADNAQHAFSSENVPMLYYAIPALEALYKAWSTCAVCPKNHPFASALYAACGKIDDYYEKTMESSTYVLSMGMCSYLLSCILDVTHTGILLVLNPKEKMGYFKKHWPIDLQEEVRKCIEEKVYPSSLLPLQ